MAIPRVFKTKITHTHLPRSAEPRARVFHECTWHGHMAMGNNSSPHHLPSYSCVLIIYNLYMYITSCLLSYFIICRYLFQVDVAAQPRESISKMLRNMYGVKHEDIPCINDSNYPLLLYAIFLLKRATWCHEAAAGFT